MQALVFVPITYWMIGFVPVAWRFFYYLLMFFQCIAMYTFFGQFLVFITPSQPLAMMLGASTSHVNPTVLLLASRQMWYTVA